MAKIVCFGEMLLRLSAPARERIFQSGSLDTNFVGAEANVAVLLARLGNQVQMVTALPSNPIGLACRDNTQKHGVSTDHIRWGNGRMGTYYLETGAVVRPSVITYDRAGSVFAETNSTAYDWAQILDGADVFFVCGITLAVSPDAFDAAKQAVETARAKGVKVVFDCNYRASLWEGREDQARAQIRDVMAMADVLFGGARDAGLILGTPIEGDTPEAQFMNAADNFFRAFDNLSLVVSTHRVVRRTDSNSLTGFAASRTERVTSQQMELEGIVDRIGGGDAFAGGVLHKLLAGKPLSEVIQFGVASSAVKHSIPGDFNLATEAEIEQVAAGDGGDVKR